MTGYKKRFFLSLVCAGLIFAKTGAAFAGATFTELQNLIDNASGTLTLTQDYKYDYDADSATVPPDGISISKGITIDGAGHTLDAQGFARVFKIAGADGSNKVTLKNVTIAKGGADSTASGGGVYIDAAGNVEFDNCVITKCGTEKGVHTADGGAALFINDGARVTLTSCDITENTGKDRAGGVYIKGIVKFYNCRVKNNSGGSRGGGVYVDNKSGVANVEMYNCTISGNKGGRGGGIYVNTENDSLNVFKNCTISGNDVSDNSVGNGGGMLFYNARAKLTNCTIANNKAKYGGGLILDVESKVEMINCTLTGNKATTGGGGLYAHDGSHTVGQAMSPVGTADFTGCVISGNSLISGDVEVSQDVTVHYSNNEDKDHAYDPSWTARYDGNFISGGYNVIGKVAIKDDEATNDAPITLADTDKSGIEASLVLYCESGAPMLKDNGGSVETISIIKNGPAYDIIPANSLLVSQDARGIPRPQGAAGDAGAFELNTPSGDSGCNAGSAVPAFFLLPLVAMTLKRK